jgi:hypothetical protein
MTVRDLAGQFPDGASRRFSERLTAALTGYG